MTVKEVIKKFNLGNIERVYFDRDLHYGGRKDEDHISTEVYEINYNNDASVDIILNTTFY